MNVSGTLVFNNNLCITSQMIRRYLSSLLPASALFSNLQQNVGIVVVVVLIQLSENFVQQLCFISGSIHLENC